MYLLILRAANTVVEGVKVLVFYCWIRFQLLDEVTVSMEAANKSCEAFELRSESFVLCISLFEGLSLLTNFSSVLIGYIKNISDTEITESKKMGEP